MNNVGHTKNIFRVVFNVCMCVYTIYIKMSCSWQVKCSLSLPKNTSNATGTQERGVGSLGCTLWNYVTQRRVKQYLRMSTRTCLFTPPPPPTHQSCPLHHHKIGSLHQFRHFFTCNSRLIKKSFGKSEVFVRLSSQPTYFYRKWDHSCPPQ